MTRTHKNSLVKFLQKSLKILQESLKILQEGLLMIMTRTCKNSLVILTRMFKDLTRTISQDYDKKI